MDYYDPPCTSRCEFLRDSEAFRRPARTAHPDVSGDPDAARFREIEKTYSVLSDCRKTAAYDQSPDDSVPVPVVSPGRRPQADIVYEAFPRRREARSTAEEINWIGPREKDHLDGSAKWILSFFSRRMP